MQLNRAIRIIVILALVLHCVNSQTNSTNSSSGYDPPPIDPNGTNGTNSSYLPPSIDDNSTNGTNSSTGSNQTNSTTPSNNQTNSTTIPYQNFTTNSTQALENTGIDVGGGLQIAPPPPITSAIVTTLYYSNIGNQFIGSKRAECLRISQSGNTSFTLDRFSRLSSSYLKSSTISYPGLWEYVTSSSNELACSMVYNQATSSYAFIYFDDVTETLSVKANISVLSLPADLQGLNMTQMSAAVVGQGCDLLKYEFSIYRINNVSLTKITGTTTVQASSSDNHYMVAGNTLYRYVQSTNSYSPLRGLKTYSSFKMASYNNRIVVWGFNSSASGPKYDVNQTVYAVLDNSGTATLLIQHLIASFQNPGQQVPVQVSPQLTKIHFQYMNTSSNSTVSVYFYDINYQSSISTTLELKNSVGYMNTIRHMPSYNPSNYFLGDYYLVIRNQSAINAPNASSVAGQSTYQFMVDTIIPLRYRELPLTEITNACFKTIIDDQELNQLIVLDLYSNNDAGQPGYNIYEFSYGNLASTIRIIPPTPDAYLTFNPPAHNYNNSNPNPGRYQWDFLSVATDTNYISYLENEQSPNHVQIDSFTLTGSSWSILASSLNCRLVSDGTQYFIYSFANNGTALSSNSTNATSSLTGGSNWKISNDCTKIKMNTNTYFTDNSGSLSSVTGPSDIISTDDLMIYAVVPTGILKYNSTDSTYSPFVTNANLSFSGGAKIYSYNNRIVVSDVDGDDIEVYAYLDNAGVAARAFYFNSVNSVNFTSPPSVLVSSMMTKILIYGLDGSNFVTSFHFIDYIKLTSSVLQFPAASVFDETNVHLALEEGWLYVRQLQSARRTLAGANQQIAYAIVFDTIIVEADRKNISSTDEANCFKYLTRVLQNGTLYVLTQCNTNISQPLVNLWQVFPQETSAASAAQDLGITQVIINGQVKLCPPGCSQCSTGACTACNDGYVFDSSSANCYICPAGCTVCNPSNPNLCSACVEGAFLSGTDCLPCDPICTTCNGSATSCQSCLPGQYFDTGNSSCQPCRRNCIECSSSTSCTLCRKGFALAANDTCRKCSRQCSNCEPNDITKCTSCNVYLQLSQGKCIPCPSRCRICSGNTCVKCDKGYRPGDDGSCVENCMLPCRTCRDNNPTHCRSCYYGSFLNGTTCSLDLTCNLGNNCTDCGQGTGFVLVGANCLRCANIDNCKQCRQTNTRACAICEPGYYIKGNRCQSCPTICSTCISNRICTSCAPGYTIPNSAPQGQCISCLSPCLTCSGTTTYCTSCVEGYTKKNWVCENNINVGFSFTLGTTDTATVLTLIDSIVSFLLQAMGLSTDKVDAVTFTSIRLGSVLLDGTADPTTGSTTSTSTTSAAAASLSSALTTGVSFGGFSVTSSSVVTNGITTSEEEGSNLGLIIGLSVGIPVAIITLVIIIYVIYKRNKLEVDEEQQEKEKESMEHIQKNLERKDEIAIMELQLGEMDSVSKHTNQLDPKNKEEDDGFSDFLQANPNPIMEPELVSDQLENYSPTPIISVNRDFEVIEKKQPPTITPLTNQIHQPSTIKKIPPPPKARIQPIIHVQPVKTEQLPAPEEDQFGEFIQEKPKKQDQAKKVERELVFEDDFGEYQNVGKVAAAPVAELDLPDEDEFGVIPSDNPSQVALFSDPIVPKQVEEKIVLPSMKPSVLDPGMFQLQLDGQSQIEVSKKEEMESEGSRY